METMNPGDAFHRVPILAEDSRDGVESVPTEPGGGHARNQVYEGWTASPAGSRQGAGRNSAGWDAAGAMGEAFVPILFLPPRFGGGLFNDFFWSWRCRYHSV